MGEFKVRRGYGSPHVCVAVGALEPSDALGGRTRLTIFASVLFVQKCSPKLDGADSQNG